MEDSESYQYYCTECRNYIVPHDKVCPHCGADTSEFIEEEDEASFSEVNPEFAKTIGRKQLFGLMGSIVLFVGVFTPIVSLPIVGSVNYFQNGKGDGVIVLVLAHIRGLYPCKNVWRAVVHWDGFPRGDDIYFC